MKTICLDAGAAPASPFWVTTGQAGGANQPILNASPAPRFNSQVQLGYCLLWTIACCLVQGCLVCLACHTWSTCLLIARHTFARRILGAAHYSLCVTTVQVPNQQLHHLAANTGQRLPLHMQVNGTSHLPTALAWPMLPTSQGLVCTMLALLLICITVHPFPITLQMLPICSRIRRPWQLLLLLLLLRLPQMLLSTSVLLDCHLTFSSSCCVARCYLIRLHPGLQMDCSLRPMTLTCQVPSPCLRFSCMTGCNLHGV